MTKLTPYIFPLADFLYIFQLLEYDRTAFLRWVGPRWYKRKLQAVGHINWTTKATALYFISLFLFLAYLAVLASPWLYFMNGFAIIFIFFALLDLMLIPIWIVVASLLLAPLEAYQKNAIVKAARKKLMGLTGITVVAVAGSVGKSSTRSFITSLLASQFKVHTPEQNFNTLLGLAGDILNKLPGETQYYIVELGEYKPGDLEKLATLTQPNLVVLTTVGTQHREQMGSQEAVYQEFLTLAGFQTVESLYINKTNILLSKLAGNTKVKVQDPTKTKAELGNGALKLPKADSTFENLSLAIGLSRDLGITNENITNIIPHLESFERRLKVSEKNGITIIDDSYNISPESARNALAYLETCSGRKIVVTGGIVDQGSNAPKANREYGQHLGKIAAVVIVANNTYHNWVIDGIKSADSNTEFVSSPHPQKTPELLAARVQPGDVVLVQNELPEEYWHG